MRAGRLRDRVEIQQRTTTQDVYGDAVPTWQTIATRWAEIAPATGRETFQAGGVQADISHVVTLRYFDGLSAKHRFKVGSSILEIEYAVSPDGVEHTAGCKEVA